MANGNSNSNNLPQIPPPTFGSWFSRLDPPTAIVICLLLLGGNKGLGVVFPELSRPDAFTGAMYEAKTKELKEELRKHSDKNRIELDQHLDDQLDAIKHRIIVSQECCDEHNHDAQLKIREYDQRLARLEAVCLKVHKSSQNGKEGN